jgi:A/G-specific adenine glycosylase
MVDRSSGPVLPFGQTATSETELVQYIDYESACKLLAENGVQDPEQRISKFVEHLPALLAWLERNGRRFPWRATTAPWQVYLSEILLQRTRARAVDTIYDQFFKSFPDPATLRAATDEEITAQIESLGFGNQRTRTLNEVAELLVTEHEGEVPRSLDELQRPWRVGPYSARATMLFAFHEPLALVDTNFARVFGRLFGYEMPDQPHKSETVYQLLDALVPETAGLCRAFNLAILDLADAICTPAEPACNRCPLADRCAYASEQNTQRS